MSQLQNKSYLECKGWICKPCNCSGAKSYDCLHKNFFNTRIRVRYTGSFKIYQKGLQIDGGLPNELQQKLTENELDKTVA
jgi:hypothetical protein